MPSSRQNGPAALRSGPLARPILKRLLGSGRSVLPFHTFLPGEPKRKSSLSPLLKNKRKLRTSTSPARAATETCAQPRSALERPKFLRGHTRKWNTALGNWTQAASSLRRRAGPEGGERLSPRAVQSPLRPAGGALHSQAWRWSPATGRTKSL